MTIIDELKDFKLFLKLQNERVIYEEETLKKLMEYRIVCTSHEEAKLYSIPFVLGNPAHHIGSALKLAAIYEIEIHQGMSYGSVGANYPKEKWLIEPKYEPVGWADRPTVQRAVCDCLINAKMDGIL